MKTLRSKLEEAFPHLHSECIEKMIQAVGSYYETPLDMGETDASQFREPSTVVDEINAQIIHEGDFDPYEDLKKELDKLRKFKEYVHERLDKIGVPSNPEPENNASHGCRIEGRLNFIFQKAASTEQSGGTEQEELKRDLQDVLEHYQHYYKGGQMADLLLKRIKQYYTITRKP